MIFALCFIKIINLFINDFDFDFDEVTKESQVFTGKKVI